MVLASGAQWDFVPTANDMLSLELCSTAVVICDVQSPSHAIDVAVSSRENGWWCAAEAHAWPRRTLNRTSTASSNRRHAKEED